MENNIKIKSLINQILKKIEIQIEIELFINFLKIKLELNHINNFF